MSDPRTCVCDLRPGSGVQGVYLVAEKELRTTRKGDLFINFQLADRTGKIPGRMWQATETIFQSVAKEGFIHLKGRVEEYRGNPQLIVEALRPVPAEQVDLSDFLAVTELDVEAMWGELLEILRGVKNRPLRLLIKKFVSDTDLVAAVKSSPAAMEMHHPYQGGLLEHTLNVARAAAALLPLYPQFNADLVLAGAFLHDIGKTAELSGGLAINYTDRGQLVGHITLAATWVAEKAAELSEELGEPFPPATLDLLQHIILSHHGVHEYGSPKLPMIPEAYFLHYLDNLDAKAYMTFHAIADDPDVDSPFTTYQRQLGTRLYKGSQHLEG